MIIFRPILVQSLYNFSDSLSSEPLNSSIKTNLNRKNRFTRLPAKRINSDKNFCISPYCNSTNKIIIRASNLQLNQSSYPKTNPYNRSIQPTINRDIRENIYNIPTNSYSEFYNKFTTSIFGPDLGEEKTIVIWNQGSTINQQNFNYNE